MSGKPINLKGKTFGRLTVSERVGRNAWGNTMWACRCSCGNIKTVACTRLRHGTKSCGCLQPEGVTERNIERTRHGHSRRNNQSSTYLAWASMLQRANNRDGQHPTYARVLVCERWQSFEDFLADMGERPEGTSLGRYCDLTNYEPDGCCWMTKAEQGLAQRNHNALLKWARLEILKPVPHTRAASHA